MSTHTNTSASLASNIDDGGCEELCELSNNDWCLNFRLGLKLLRCPDQKCVDNLCGIAQDCEERENFSENLGCPIVFDGWSCINTTLPGSNILFPCPNFEHLNFQPKNFASRQCNWDGKWYDNLTSKAFTRYDSCPDSESFLYNDIINKLYVTGYSISLGFLLFATAIFLFFRSLRCIRNSIHTHLFIASIFHNLCWIIWYQTVIYQMGSVISWSDHHFLFCKILHVLTNYFMVCTYMWMFGEGLYLFIILIVTFVSENKVFKLLLALGWGLPFLLILTYASVRGVNSGLAAERSCWIEEISYNWIYKVPCILSIFVNFIFLIIIISLLVSKLHTEISDTSAIVKTAKAIGILIPLFGLHKFLSAFKPDDPGERVVLDFLSAITISFQGTVVATLFCLINSEVISQLRKFCGDRFISERSRTANQSIAMTQYTAFSTGLTEVPNTEL
ncbi:diuretic hormone receptor isoform X2 [Lepeophtheirus salmonis]